MAAKGVLAAVLLAACERDDPVLACRHSIVINEVMAASGEDDWIELFNDSDSEEDLEGFVLSTTKWASQWTFPAVRMEPRGFVQVWAVGYLEEGKLSTDFDLNRDGDALYLRAPSEERSQLCDDVTYPDQHAGVSYARNPDGGEWCYAAELTPAGENTGCF